MTRYLAYILTIVLLTACGTAQSVTPTLPPQPVSTLEAHYMKSYELYSWQSDGVRHFSVLIGTNKMKTLDEITNAAMRLNGVQALKDQFKRLAAGEFVTWSVLQGGPAMALSPDEVVSDIRAYCAQLGLEYSLATP